MATVDEVLAQLSDSDDIYDDDYPYQFEIDNDLRVISVPSDGVVLGVEHDKDINLIKFVMPRYYKRQDLGSFSIRIHYENAAGSMGYYLVPDKQVNEDTIEFGWILSYDVTAYQGTVNFAIKLYTLVEGSDSEIDQAFNTTLGTANVLVGMDVDSALTPSIVEDTLARLQKYADAIVAQASTTLTEDVTKVNTQITEAETKRVSAENARIKSETERVTNETDRENNEANRQAFEQTRTRQESARVSAENDRASKFSAYETAESSRVDAEKSRVFAENARVSAEKLRVTAEDDRDTGEELRIESETDRVTAEKNRAASETARVNSETSRSDAETKRVSNESSRTSAEESRVSSETDRVSAETARVKSETSRTIAETKRVEAESGRQQNESGRVGAEASRVSAETGRANAESGRVDAEKTRVAAESTRETKTAAAIAKAETAANTANVKATLADEAAARADLAASKVNMPGSSLLKYDSENGCYDNDSIAQMFRARANGKIYGYREYKSAVTQIEKIYANAGIANPVPGTIGNPGTNPYAAEGSIFDYYRCNCDAKDDGSPVVYLFKGDEGYSDAHAEYDTGTARCVQYFRVEETDTYIDKLFSDSWHVGFTPEPGAILPDGSLRPYMLNASYPLSQVGSQYRSTSGVKPLTMTVSHNSMITQLKQTTTGNAGKSFADDAYVQHMFALMFGTKNSQSVFAGTTNYNISVRPSVAETGVKRVIIPTSTANNLIVGSGMQFGSCSNGGTDRGSSDCRDIFYDEQITKIEKYDDTHSAVYFENVENTFNTTTTSYLQTSHWWCGTCDDVVGMGSPTNCKSAKEPFVFQGIEMMHGFYEILSDQVLANTDKTGFRVYRVYDTHDTSTSAPTSKYVPLDVVYARDATNDGWEYPMYSVADGGGNVPAGVFGASTTTGNCDGIWLNPKTSSGSREWRSWGNLWSGANAGFRCVDAGGWLGGTRWDIGSRRSFVGRKGVNVTQ